MIRIAVVEDENSIRDFIFEKINQCIHTECSYEIHKFASAEQMLETIDKGYVYHIVFSDIEMPGMNGIELGLKLKDKFPMVYLIYLTSHTNFAVDSYCIEAYQYILKSHIDNRLPRIVDDLIWKIERDLKNFIILGSSTDIKKVYFSDIVYLRKKKTSKYVEIVTRKENYYERDGIRNVLAKLQSTEFIEIERGCVVNMRYIEGIKDNIVKMPKNVELVISRARITNVKERINRYWREY